MVPQKAHPLLRAQSVLPCQAWQGADSCNKALVPYLCGSSQLLRMGLLFPRSWQAPQEVIFRPTGMWSSVTRDAGMGPRMNALPPVFTELDAPLQSGKASIPPSQKQIPPIRKGSPSHSLPLSLQYSPSLHLSPPDPADMFISLISTTPARPLCSLCKWHPLELSNRAAGLPQNRSSLIRHLLCSKAQSRCSMHNC